MLLAPRTLAVPTLLLLAACGTKTPDTGADTADTGDTAETGDTADTADTADTDTGDTGDTGGTDTGETIALGANFAAELTRTGGCSDMIVHAARPDETVSLFLRADGAVASAWSAGGPMSWSYDAAVDAPPAPLDLRVDVGRDLLADVCTDILEATPVVTQRWIPVAGTVTLTVTPVGTTSEPWDSPAQAELTLAGTSFAPADAPGGEPVPSGDVAISARVGWLPG